MTTHFLALLLPFLLVSAPATSGHDRDAVTNDATSWQIDFAHSEVGFKVRHLGMSTVRGQFESFDASFDVDPSDLNTFRGSARIDAHSINTRNERRDNHLRSDDFFDAANHSELFFESKRVENVNGNAFQIVGDLTIRGTTHEVVLDAALVGNASTGENPRIAIEAETTIDRFDYGLRWDRMTEVGGLVVSRDVTIVLVITGVR